MAKLPEDVAIRVMDIRKDFHLPHNNEDSIKHKVITAFQKKDKEIDTQHALRGISFDIKKGEFFGIIGRNGSGKSTLLKIIAEIYQPTKGKVRRRGSLVAFIELGVGFNPQLTGKENVYLNAALLGFSRKQIDVFYDEVVEFAELAEFMEQKLKNYSSGMKVRLAFAVAIQAHADILVLDEVLAVGDADFQRKCYNYFKELKNEQKTIILVSHSMGLIREYCDRAILIEEGEIAHEGVSEEIADEYLKLFNKAEGNTRLIGKRWGSGLIKIHSLKMKVSQEVIELVFHLEASDAPVHDVVLGFRIKDGQEKLLAGANNLNAIEGAQGMNFSPNQFRTLRFTMPNIFGNGNYSIGATVRLSDGVTIFDSWDSIKTFSNTKDEVYYPVLCPVRLVIDDGAE